MTTLFQGQLPGSPGCRAAANEERVDSRDRHRLMIAGLIALSSVVFATRVTVFVVGIMMLVSSIAEVINAFQFKSWGKFLLWLGLGLLYDTREDHPGPGHPLTACRSRALQTSGA